MSAVGPRACAPSLPGHRGAPVVPTPADRVLAPALLAGVSSRAALLTARPVRACALLLLICRPVRDMRTACPGYPARIRCSRTSVGSWPLRGFGGGPGAALPSTLRQNPWFSAIAIALNLICSAMRPTAAACASSAVTVGRALHGPALRCSDCAACRAAPVVPRLGACAPPCCAACRAACRATLRAPGVLSCRAAAPPSGRLRPLDKGCRACTYPGPCDYIQYITRTSDTQDVCMILHNGA